MEYQGKMLELVKILLKILALGLPDEWGCPPDIFDELAVNPSMPMRLLHYAPHAAQTDIQFGGMVLFHLHNREE
jgi:isopenicillin N synthase-like dioxygenase